MTDSVDYINGLLEQSSAPFRCQFSEGRGRFLVMIKEIDTGDILFQGPLLHKVAEDVRHPVYIELTRLFHFDQSDALDYSPMWYWCALNSLSFKISDFLPCITEEQSRQLGMLYHPKQFVPSPTIRRVVGSIRKYLTHDLTESELMALDEMTIIWTLNCFEHADDPLTYASFFLPSFMSHSCGPNAMWATVRDTFSIRAQRPMKAGDELTVSYLSEEFSLRPIAKRREHLQSTKFFACDCWRCTAELDDTRGFPIPKRFGTGPECFIRYSKLDKCVYGCGSVVSLSESELERLISLEADLVDTVTELDGSDAEDTIPVRPDPKLFSSDEQANYLSDLVEEMGLFHWATIRGLYQLSEYYKSIAMYPRAIEMTRKRIEGRQKFVRATNPSMSSGLAWALEELGDLLLLHVSGSVVAGLCEEARERFCETWMPRSQEDFETLKACGAWEAYNDALQILTSVFGPDHEHTITARAKVDALRTKLELI